MKRSEVEHVLRAAAAITQENSFLEQKYPIAQTTHLVQHRARHASIV